MTQSWKEIVDKVAGPEKDPVVYDFSDKGGRKFYGRKNSGAYDGNNDNSYLLTESGDALLTTDNDHLIWE